jgi:hypothetical protein
MHNTWSANPILLRHTESTIVPWDERPSWMPIFSCHGRMKNKQMKPLQIWWKPHLQKVHRFLTIKFRATKSLLHLLRALCHCYKLQPRWSLFLISEISWKFQIVINAQMFVIAILLRSCELFPLCRTNILACHVLWNKMFHCFTNLDLVSIFSLLAFIKEKSRLMR